MNPVKYLCSKIGHNFPEIRTVRWYSHKKATHNRHIKYKYKCKTCGHTTIWMTGTQENIFINNGYNEQL